MELSNLLDKGGVVMVVLILLSIYALAVMFYKIFQFVQAGIFNSDFINPVMDDVKRGELTAAEHKLRSAHGPIATIMKVAVVCVTNRMMSSKSRDAEISRVGSAEIMRLESHMRGLEMVATTAPLLGLLGTVMGMVAAFSQLEAAGSRVDPSMLAGGIWSALLTTVAGLIVAIPAVGLYHILDGIIERVRATMGDVTVQIVALEDEFMRNEQEQERRRIIEEARREKEEMTRQQREEHERFISEIKAVEEKKSKLEIEQYKNSLKAEVKAEVKEEVKKEVEQEVISREMMQAKRNAEQSAGEHIRIESKKNKGRKAFHRKNNAPRRNDAPKVEVDETKAAEEKTADNKADNKVEELPVRTQQRSTPPSSSTLRMLSPSYKRF